MNLLLKIEYIDGSCRLDDLQAYVSSEALGAGNLLTEFYIRFDDISEGLFVEISHHAIEQQGRPSEDMDDIPSEGDELCLGEKAYIYNDYYMQLISPEELKSKVFKVSLEGVPLLINLDGELINLAKSNQLTELYGLRSNTGLLIHFADLAERLEEEAMLDESDGIDSEIALMQRDQRIAWEIGISVDLLNRAKLLKQLSEEENEAVEDYDETVDEIESMGVCDE